MDALPPAYGSCDGLIGLYLCPASCLRKKTRRCARLQAFLKHEGRILASYGMNKKLHDYGSTINGFGQTKFISMTAILEDESIERNDTLSLEYVIAEYPDNFVNASQSAPLGLQPSLLDLRNMMGLIFDDAKTADICFIIRHSVASNDRPRRIYGLTKILAFRCDYFRTLFRSGFSENEDKPTDSHMFNEHQWEMGSDSDYDHEETTDTEDGAEDYEIEMSGSSTPEFEQTEIKSPAINKVYIMDSTYRTYRAMLYYLYTGCITFAPLRSIYNAAKEKALTDDPDCEFPDISTYDDENALVISPNGERGEIQWVSAKSMYRLCDKLGIADLKTAAAKFIHDSLTPETVLHELRSTFSPLFPEIYQDQKTYLEEHRSEFCRTKSFETYMTDLFANDSGDHTTIMLKFIMLAIKGSEDKEPAGKSDSS